MRPALDSRCQGCASFTLLAKQRGFEPRGHCAVHRHTVSLYGLCGEFTQGEQVERKFESSHADPAQETLL